MNRNVIWATLFALIAGILQSTILSRLAILQAVPDLALNILVYSAYINGAMTGQVTGFCSGFILDFLSAAPLGLNAFVRTLIGAFAGFINSAFFMDGLFLPMALCGGATLAKAAILYPLHALFQGSVVCYSFYEPTLWVELAMNTLLAPPLFFFLKLFNPLLLNRRDT